MHTLVTRIIMRDGGELGSSCLLAWVTPVPGECSNLWADKVTSRKLRICLFFRQIQTSHLRSCAHKTPKAQGTKLSLERGFSLWKANSCQLLPPVCPHYHPTFVPQGKKSHSVF